jgi:hypothetical protein
VVGNCTPVGRSSFVSTGVTNCFCAGINKKTISMLFKYKISLEIEVDFEAPLLGVDPTKGRRKQAGVIAIEALREMVKIGTTSHLEVDRKIEEEGLPGTIKGKVTLRSHRMIEEDEKNK